MDADYEHPAGIALLGSSPEFALISQRNSLRNCVKWETCCNLTWLWNCSVVNLDQPPLGYRGSQPGEFDTLDTWLRVDWQLQQLKCAEALTWSKQASLSSAASVAADWSESGQRRIWNLPQWLMYTWIYVICKMRIQLGGSLWCSNSSSIDAILSNSGRMRLIR